MEEWSDGVLKDRDYGIVERFGIGVADAVGFVDDQRFDPCSGIPLAFE